MNEWQFPGNTGLVMPGQQFVVAKLSSKIFRPTNLEFVRYTGLAPPSYNENTWDAREFPMGLEHKKVEEGFDQAFKEKMRRLITENSEQKIKTKGEGRTDYLGGYRTNSAFLKVSSESCSFSSSTGRQCNCRLAR